MQDLSHYEDENQRQITYNNINYNQYQDRGKDQFLFSFTKDLHIDMICLS